MFCPGKQWHLCGEAGGDRDVRGPGNSCPVHRDDKEHDIRVKVGVMPFFLLDF